MSGQTYDTRHGGPYDRGRADSYYRRPFSPHYFKGGSYESKPIRELTEAELAAYTAGYTENDSYKNWY